MRIAVSGTHCSGKSTLIDEFLIAHPDFAHEPEPYQVLSEEFGEAFSAQPSAEEFFRQLEYNFQRLQAYESNDNVIFERCPVDFLAYMLALNDLGTDQQAARVIDYSLDIVTSGLKRLDLIALLPINDLEAIDEDEELRNAVDVQLTDLLVNDCLNLFSASRPAVLEVKGSTGERLKLVEQALELSLRGTKQ